jgi:hypothetical protein
MSRLSGDFLASFILDTDTSVIVESVMYIFNDPDDLLELCRAFNEVYGVASKEINDPKTKGNKDLLIKVIEEMKQISYEDISKNMDELLDSIDDGVGRLPNIKEKASVVFENIIMIIFLHHFLMESDLQDFYEILNSGSRYKQVAQDINNIFASTVSFSSYNISDKDWRDFAKSVRNFRSKNKNVKVKNYIKEIITISNVHDILLDFCTKTYTDDALVGASDFVDMADGIINKTIKTCEKIAMTGSASYSKPEDFLIKLMAHYIYIEYELDAIKTDEYEFKNELLIDDFLFIDTSSSYSPEVLSIKCNVQNLYFKASFNNATLEGYYIDNSSQSCKALSKISSNQFVGIFSFNFSKVITNIERHLKSAGVLQKVSNIAKLYDDVIDYYKNNHADIYAAFVKALEFMAKNNIMGMENRHMKNNQIQLSISNYGDIHDHHPILLHSMLILGGHHIVKEVIEKYLYKAGFSYNEIKLVGIRQDNTSSIIIAVDF